MGMSGKWPGIPIGNYPTSHKPVSQRADSWESFLKRQVSSHEACRLILLLRNLSTLSVARRNVPSPCNPPRSGAEERLVVGITPQSILNLRFQCHPVLILAKIGVPCKIENIDTAEPTE
jgi:hypothetical protein